MTEVKIGGYCAGAIGRVTELHADYYHRRWGFGLFFEARVASEMADFLSRFDGRHDGFWTLLAGGKVAGAIAIDGSQAAQKGAHLRWFIIAPELKGQGWGKRLLAEAITFCDERAFPRTGLWTFAGLDAARHLYEAFGFQLISQAEGTQWGTPVLEQRFERPGAPAAGPPVEKR